MAAYRGHGISDAEGHHVGGFHSLFVWEAPYGDVDPATQDAGDYDHLEPANRKADPLVGISGDIDQYQRAQHEHDQAPHERSGNGPVTEATISTVGPTRAALTHSTVNSTESWPGHRHSANSASQATGRRTISARDVDDNPPDTCAAAAAEASSADSSIRRPQARAWHSTPAKASPAPTALVTFTW